MISADILNTYHFWDCWYWYDPNSQIFHVFRLCATQAHRAQKVQDLFSQLAYATSRDLHHFDYHNLNLIPPKRGSSIWSGCTFQHPNGSYYLFYTERQTSQTFWANQVIQAAYSSDLQSWQSLDLDLSMTTVDPKAQVFQRLPQLGDRTIHAWRDPYLFAAEGSIWMLVAAKSLHFPQHQNACIALLKASDDSLTTWELACPYVVAGFEELEVPQIYWDQSTSELVVVASTWAEQDYQISQQQGYDPLLSDPEKVYRQQGYVLGFRFSSLTALTQSTGKVAAEVLVAPSKHHYAGMIVPELQGSVLGFNTQVGVHQMLGSRFPSFRHLREKSEVG